ncbi:hypothetical protein ACSBR1_007968 [Camellia fascicularis]
MKSENVTFGNTIHGKEKLENILLIELKLDWSSERLLKESRTLVRRIQLSLSILLLGVGIATVTDLQLNIMGSILSLLAVVTTCVAQFDTNKHAVYSLLVFVILLQLKVFIVLSCLIAVSVNFSTFLVIGKASPVMYQAKEGESDPLMSARKV